MAEFPYAVRTGLSAAIATNAGLFPLGFAEADFFFVIGDLETPVVMNLDPVGRHNRSLSSDVDSMAAAVNAAKTQQDS